MTEMNIELRNPPAPINGSPGQVAKFIEELKKHPSTYIVWCKNSNVRTAYSKTQQYKKRYPGTEWLVRSEDGAYTIFGRWHPLPTA